MRRMPTCAALALFLAAACLSPASPRAAAGPAEAPEVEMAVVVPDHWVTPKAADKALVVINLKITNHGTRDLWFNLYDTVVPTMKNAEGKVLLQDGVRMRTAIPKPAHVAAGQTATVDYVGTFCGPADKSAPLVTIADKTGGVWIYHDLVPGQYTFQLAYANTSAKTEGLATKWPELAGATIWVGKATTAPVTFTVEAVGAKPEEKPKDAKP